jgi:hypothetical protein
LQQSNISVSHHDHTLAFDDPWRNRVLVVRTDALPAAVSLATNS